MSLDGRQWTSDKVRFRYCAKGDTACVKAAAEAAAGAPSSAGRSGGTPPNGSTRKGVAIGVGMCLGLLVVGAIVVYVKRQEVGEWAFWALAASRFQRLHQDSPADAGRRGSAVGVEEGGRRSGSEEEEEGDIMLMDARAIRAGSSSQARHYSLLRVQTSEDDEEGGEGGMTTL